MALVLFACEVWLQKLATKEYPRSNGSVGTWTAMLARISNDDNQRLKELERGYKALSLVGRAHLRDHPTPHMADTGIASDTGRRNIERFIRMLDDHLVRTFPERPAHLFSFYASLDVHSAGESNWVDPAAFASAWAAGPSRSKFESLERGRQAAALAQELRDEIGRWLKDPARPSSPYDNVNRTNEALLRETCDELITIACLPPSSGAAAATRYLAVIGEIALERIDLHLFGDRKADGKPAAAPAWRLLRVLTKVGEISANQEVAKQVWGPMRMDAVRAEALRLLEDVLTVETPNVNRARSLTAEAFRVLGAGDSALWAHTYARLERGRTAQNPDGEAIELVPFGERGFLSPREQAYVALALTESKPDKAPAVIKTLRVPLVQGFDGINAPVNAARLYTAAFLRFKIKHGCCPPLAVFAPLIKRQLEAELTDPLVSTVSNPSLYKVWLQETKALLKNVDPVTSATSAVWSALRSSLDEPPRPPLTGQRWRNRREHESARKHGTEADRILAEVPMHARFATRSMVAQALLQIDGTARRDAIECLRQSGLADVAARLFQLVVAELRVQRRSAVSHDMQQWQLDWLREQAVFCMSYTGSTVGLPTLMEEAGLPGRDAKIRRSGVEPDQTPETSRWIHTTALLGLADLGDVLHDDDTQRGREDMDHLLESIHHRVRELSGDNCRAFRADPQTHPSFRGLCHVQDGEEWRGLVVALAMLRSESDLSVRLLHVLSGRALIDHEHPGRYWSSNPEYVRRESGRRDRVRYYAARRNPDPEWEVFKDQLSNAAGRWDLVTWQFAEWGLQRIYRRFRNPTSAEGVRLSSPLEACEVAAQRLRIAVQHYGDIPERVRPLLL